MGFNELKRNGLIGNITQDEYLEGIEKVVITEGIDVMEYLDIEYSEQLREYRIGLIRIDKRLIENPEIRELEKKLEEYLLKDNFKLTLFDCEGDENGYSIWRFYFKKLKNKRK